METSAIAESLALEIVRIVARLSPNAEDSVRRRQLWEAFGKTRHAELELGLEHAIDKRWVILERSGAVFLTSLGCATIERQAPPSAR